MDWLQAKPVIAVSTRAFIQNAENHADPLTAWCRNLASPDAQAAWLLLGCALHQGIALPPLLSLLDSLKALLGEDAAFQLPAPREAVLQNAFRQVALTGDWELLPQLPGIVWSVGRFVRNRNQPFAEWVKASSPRDIWRACGEIHYMGKNSAQRPKVLEFLFRLQSPSPAGLGWSLAEEGGRPPLPVTMGARRWLAWIGPWSETMYAEEGSAGKMKIIQKLYEHLSPQAPWKACHALLFYTEPAGHRYLCMELSGSCDRCPLVLECPRRRVSDA